ncbi:hypothetical protein SAMN05444487_111111 [Marininema mesophilum]|uniref:Xaa-Pro dipeptidyl-peptidase-like domain-containing protein n=1 Tax=Marininema mesophilum TaxID=1048340 RepID=A0A1H2ZL31_9BACL|nr:alpha/beta fold hydrolase [Marininema mesophilum]SDX18071.1 hypothetical protein SAMN05444487_111111 [Marininema mesophilum]
MSSKIKIVITALSIIFIMGSILMVGNQQSEAKSPTQEKEVGYKEREVKYKNKAAGVTLAGTLTLPQKSSGPVPAVLLIAGSGPMDRDETLGPHKPFKVLAKHLAQKGIAVLRVDKRGVGESTGRGKFDTATTNDFASDAQAGVNYLKTLKDINSNQIGLIGHSEGAMIAPIVAKNTDDVAFIASMAGPAAPVKEVILEQVELTTRAQGAPEELIKKNLKTFKLMSKILKKEESEEKARTKLKKMLTKNLGELSEAQKRKYKAYGVVTSYEEVKDFNSAWGRNFLPYDPEATLKQVKVPVLAINGGLDLQVSSKQNLPAMAEALEDAGNKDYTIVKFPRLNHLFQTAKTGSPAEYETIKETISPSVLNTISSWILERTINKK